jgi:cobalt/nickel transport system ATP-binding protein
MLAVKWDFGWARRISKLEACASRETICLSSVQWSGLVFQNPDDQLFSPTVFEDVAFGPLHMGLPETDVFARVDSALEAVRMSGYRDRLSHHLSVGEKKRIAIATVLSMNPSILILDEPSAGLDPRARRTLINLLRELPITMLVSTHDMRLVKSYSRA